MFIHLRVRSDYSLLESILKTDHIIKFASENEMPAVALTDKNNLCGALEFANYATKDKVQPIIGVELTIESHLETRDEYLIGNLLLLVQSEIGYKNLLFLVKLYYEKRLKNQYVRLEDIKSYSEGLIALSGFHDSVLWICREDNYQSIVKKLKDIFTKNRFYIEIQRCGEPKDNEIEEFLLKIADDFELPIVATNNVLFGNKSSHAAHEVAICIGDGSYLASYDRRVISQEHYFKSSDVMERIFEDLPEAVLNTKIIVTRCYFKPDNRPPTLPKYSEDENEELMSQAKTGMISKMKKNLVPHPEIYNQRMKYELEVIINMGFAGYFLIVADFINWSKQHDIPVGPGRGSAAGSLIAWYMGITDVDPIRFGLLFERFLNPERISMPDIDVDFCQEKRGLVIEYIKNKYGINNVAHIITFGALQARAVLRDVGRVLGMPYGQVDNICKMIPFNPAHPVTLSEAIELDERLKEEARSDETVRKLLEISLELEGILRNQSTHAAGIVISDRPLYEVVPVCRDLNTGDLLTQFHMKPLESAGLVKFDFLGLTTLTLLDRLYKLIEQRHGVEIDFEKIELKLDDSTTYEMLTQGDAVGVFQLDSGIMKDGLKKIRPDRFEDIIALTSINRPGPMENLPDYIGRKFGKREIDYLHPSLENLLRETFGIIVYQEQVMEIAKILSGYSLGSADILRRAMGKKIQSEMDAQKSIFVEGCLENDISRDRSEFIFDLVAKFAGYGFNKSHATAYSLISYYTAWLKVHYKLEFITVLMNLEMHDTDKLVILKDDAEKSEIRVLSPDINLSEVEFSIEKKNIRYGIAACKSAGKAIAEQIVESRRRIGKFKNIGDFLNRFNTKIINKRFLEAMIKAGAFDSLYPNRAELFISVEDMINFTQKNNTSESRQGFLFDLSLMDFTIQKKAPNWTKQEKMYHEFEALGFHLTDHPINYFRNFLDNRNVSYSKSMEINGYQKEVAMVGVVTYIRIRSSKRGKFANITLSDIEGLFELFIYDDDLIQKKGHLLKEGTLLFCKVRVNVDRDTKAFRMSILDLDNLIELIKEEKAVFELEVTDELDVIALSKVFGQKNRDGKTHYFLRYMYAEYRMDIRLPDSYDFPLDLGKLQLVSGVKRIIRVI